MADEVTICNQALSWLAVSPIISLNDSSKQAVLCKTNYAQLRDTVLEEGRWSFATFRDTLTTKATPSPDWGFANRFLLPTTTLLVIQARDDDNDDDGRSNIKWSVEDGHLLCDVDTVYIKYIKQVTNVTRFTNTFRQALAARIAAELAPPLTESTNKEIAMWNLYQKKLDEALFADGAQGSPRRTRSTSLKDVR